MNTIMNACAPVINEATTNCCDVEIVISICITVAVIVLIVAIAAYLWHRKSLSTEVELKEKELEFEKVRKNNEQMSNTGNANVAKSTPSQKTNSEKAKDLLKELSALVKPKEGDINKDILDHMVALYDKLKKGFDDEKTTE